MSEEVYLGERVPGTLRDILKAHVLRDTHMSESEFIRDAVREKLQREAPDLFDQIVKRNGKKIADEEDTTRTSSAAGLSVRVDRRNRR